jgi:multiple sugar transport system permease protein
MVAPFVVPFALVTIVPMASSIALSAFSYDMLSMPSWAGLDNYLRMFLYDNVFLIALKNTLVLATVTGPVGFFLAYILAWLINEYGPVKRSLLSFAFYSPALAGNVYFIWQVLFSGDSYGYINGILLQIGLIAEPIQWFRDQAYSLGIVIVVQLWLSMGISFLANIAGLQSVNPTYYEAGAIDGIRSRWQELWYITLPSMKGILLFGAVMQIQATFSISYVAMTLTGFPSVNYTTHTIVTHLIDVGTVRYEMGYASAISVLLFLVMAFIRILVGKLIHMTGK